MVEEKVYWIYYLRDPRDNAVRYIGYTCEPSKRLRGHVNRATSGDTTHKSRWLQLLLRQGLEPQMDLIECCTEAEVQSKEVEHIALGRKLGWRLTNATDGGEGILNASLETRAKISRSRIGKPLSPETRAKMSSSRTGVPRGPCKPETRDKIRLALSNPSNEFRERQRIAQTGRPVAQSTRDKLSLAGRRKHSEESVRKRSDKNRGQIRTPEQRARMSEAAKLRQLRTPMGPHSAEHRAKIGEGNKRRSPEFRKAIAAKGHETRRRNQALRNSPTGTEQADLGAVI